MALAPQLVTLSNDETFGDDDWKELIGTTAPGGGDSFTASSSEAALVGLVDAYRTAAAVRYFTGYAQCDDVAPWQLHRKNPVRHPRYPWMFSSGVSFTYIEPKGNFENPNNEPWVDAATVGIPNQEGPLTRTSNYEKAFATVRFSQLPYPVLSDEEFQDDPFLQGQDSTGAYNGIPLEVHRNCIIYDGVEPSFNLLQADGEVGMLKWAETGVGGPPSQPTLGTKFPAPLGVPQCKVAFSIKWVDVPDAYIFGTEYVPNKIVGGLGRVNENYFLGFVPGVLWLSAVRFERFTPPLWATSMPAISWNVSMIFEFFDPEKGVPASSYRGHNLMPFSGSLGYYYCTRDGNPAGQPYLGKYDYNKLFEHNNKP